MDAEERRRELLKVVQTRKSVGLDELVEHLGVSRMTVHRDLDLLAARGLLRKQRGGASAESSLLFESNFHYRQEVHQPEKIALAKVAARLIEPGHVIMLDDSTTTLQICEEIKDIENVTVITNSLAVCEKLRARPDTQLVLAGGNYNDTLEAFYGLLCEQTLRKLRADWTFMSAPSVIGTCLYHQDQEVVRIKRAMMEAAGKSVMLLDAAKFRTRALTQFAELTEFDHIFIDRQIDPAAARSLQQAGITFELV
jgi:DeoR/GlpR family transcriptional regulator of sugar metabolism